MDGRGGCCIARYSSGGLYESYDMSKVDRIMLRFRPIAPRPVAGGDVTGTGEKVEQKKKRVKSPRMVGGRGKRRYPNPNPNNKRIKCASPESLDRDVNDRTVVTLPLLPESPEPEVFAKETNNIPSPTWLNLDQGCNPDHPFSDHDRTEVAGSSVTVVCVTDTWTDGSGLGRTDQERKANLEKDTCPGFVSDSFGRVTWTNWAYRSMLSCHGGADVATPWLVMKERLPAGATLAYPAFTCRVRLQCHVNGQIVMKKTLPCDVWRLDGGGLAWRLDVNAALCLGR